MFPALRYWLALPLLLLTAAQAAWADPPARVGRLSLLDGEVSIRQEDSSHSESVSPNWPLTSGDELETGPDGRAEIRVGSSALRLGSRTAIRIVTLDDERIRVRLDEGTVAVRVRNPEPAAAIEIETRDGDVVPIGPGHFRVDYDDATVSLTSYRGELNFRSDGNDVIVTEGQQAHVRVAEGTALRWDAPENDDFAAWVLARDERDDALGTPHYVSPEMTGVEDLSDYGDWRTSDEYGAVWYPHGLAPDWAPYRSGRWISVAPWGWTWVDDAPWGFAPFHYGRWVLIDGTWAWVPGDYVARPVYAPALVVWLGLPGVSIGLSSDSVPHVGWFPLAPREVYVPSYRYSPTYVREINITHVTNVVEITRIAREPRHARHAFRDHRKAVTLVRGDVVRDSRPVFRHAKRLDDRVWKLPRTATPIPPLEAHRVVERSRRTDDRPRHTAPRRAREDADGRRHREPDATPGAAQQRRFFDADGERHRGRVDSSAVRREERDQLRRGPDVRPGAVERRAREMPRGANMLRENERDERVREPGQPREERQALQPSQPNPQPRPDAARLDSPRAQERERREREQQSARARQAQRSEARRQEDALRGQRQQQLDQQQRSRQEQQRRANEQRQQEQRQQEQQQRADQLRAQQTRERQARQVEQQRQREAQERQRFDGQRRQHEREQLDQRRQGMEQQRQAEQQQRQREAQERQRFVDERRQHEREQLDQRRKGMEQQRQVEQQQRQREAQERQRFVDERRQRERERLEQRRQVMEQQRQQQPQLRQERERRAPAMERSGRREVEPQRGRPPPPGDPATRRGRDEDGRRGN